MRRTYRIKVSKNRGCERLVDLTGRKKREYIEIYPNQGPLTLTALQRRRTEAAEMKLLRPLAGYTLYDHKTNDSIRRELQTECILDKIDEYRRNWLLHLQKMPQNRIPLKSYHYRPQGRRPIGRPKKRWREQLQLWRRNGSKGPILDVYDDDDDYQGPNDLYYSMLFG